MALIEWRADLSVEVAEIDRQHQKLVAMINDLHQAMSEGKGKERLGDIVNDLVSYTNVHFKTEENYFAKFGYPDTAAHKKEHAAFVVKVSEFKSGFENGELSLTLEVMQFLSKWLRTHIKGTDKKYTQFFNDKGLN